jgi:hypothetical protein
MDHECSVATSADIKLHSISSEQTGVQERRHSVFRAFAGGSSVCEDFGHQSPEYSSDYCQGPL